MKQSRGFTLIELLVTIAIIGLLALIAIFAFRGARQKARDAQRLSDVRQMAGELLRVDVETAFTPIPTCGAGDLTTDCDQVGLLVWDNFTDPSKSTNVCTNVAPNDLCGYTMGLGGATTGDFEICFVTEADSALGAAGIYRIDENGSFSAGCTN